VDEEYFVTFLWAPFIDADAPIGSVHIAGAGESVWWIG
jgi:hypothetical protein